MKSNANQQVAFVICTDNEDAYMAVKANIDGLLCPDGIEKIVIWAKAAVCNGAVFNRIVEQVPCRYKVYIHPEVRIINQNFIADLLILFSDKRIAMVGFWGSLEKPVSGNWRQARHQVGKAIFEENGSDVEKQLLPYEGNVPVQWLDNRFYATQYDVRWQEVFQGNYFSVLAHCDDFQHAGYKIVVPYQESAWCQYDCLPEVNVDSNDLGRYLEIYAPYVKLPNESTSTKNLLYRLGRNSVLHEAWQLMGAEGISIADNVSIKKGACLSLPLGNFAGSPRIIIGNGCNIEHRFSVSAANCVIIENNVGIAANVYIADHEIKAEMVGIPVIHQGISSVGRVIIGAGSYIGYNAVIVGNVKIGRGCVIMANSVVTADIPPYCVVAGSPARIIKAFDYKQKKWLSINSHSEWQKVFASRPKAVNDGKRVAVDMYVYEQKNIIGNDVAGGRLEIALQRMSNVASFLYNYNQYYADDDMEQLLLKIEKQLELPLLADCRKDKEPLTKRRVLFYDGFGLDTRGLAQIYLEALALLGCHVVYAVSENAKAKIPTLLRAVHKGSGEVVYLPVAGYVQSARNVVSLMEQTKVDTAFFYTTPWDVSAMIAFHHAEDSITRYQINLTDHAFWLGLNTFDYCVEFRDYGAALSDRYRHIQSEKLLLQPYYPPINENFVFEGFPFERAEKDFVIFSGGSIYKTMDDEHTYYKLVEWLLTEFPQVKFWFASYGSCTELDMLLKKFPGRMAHTRERKDLAAIMRHVDMYLNTYPMCGGLMTQFSSVCGRLPLTLCDEGDLGGLLLNERELGIVFHRLEDIKKEARRLIENESYRHQKEKMLVKSVISPMEFNENVGKMLSKQISEFPIGRYAIEKRIGSLQKQFYNRFVASHKKEFEDY